MKSPAYIRALLDIHTLPSPEVNEYLLRELEEDSMIESGAHGLQTTRKADAYIEMLRSVPLPVQVWSAPK